jgi:mannose-6-phosphate isomerase-like protein (cupin superfamily)
MSEYTIVNLKEVEDQAPKWNLSPDLEARFARVALDAEQVGLTYQRLAPNYQVPWGHTHKTQEEVYVVLGGSVRVKIGDEIHELGPMDAIRVHKDTPRGFEAGPDGVELLAIGAPGGPGDAVNIENYWDESESSA